MDTHPILDWIAEAAAGAAAAPFQIYCIHGTIVQRNPLQVLNHRLSHITRNVLVDIVLHKRHSAVNQDQSNYDRIAQKRWRTSMKSGLANFLTRNYSGDEAAGDPAILDVRQQTRLVRQLTDNTMFQQLSGIDVPPADEDAYGAADSGPFGPFRIDLVGQLQHDGDDLDVPAEHHPESYIQSTLTVARDAKLLIHMAWQAIRTQRQISPKLYIVQWVDCSTNANLGQLLDTYNEAATDDDRTQARVNLYAAAALIDAIRLTICRGASNNSSNHFGFTINVPRANAAVERVADTIAFNYGRMGNTNVGEYGPTLQGGDNTAHIRRQRAMQYRVHSRFHSNGTARRGAQIFQRGAPNPIHAYIDGRYAVSVPSQYSDLECVIVAAAGSNPPMLLTRVWDAHHNRHWEVRVNGRPLQQHPVVSPGSIVSELMEQPLWPDSIVDPTLHISMKRFTPFHQTNVKEPEKEAITNIANRALDETDPDYFVLHKDVEQQLNPIGETYPVLEFGANPTQWCCGRHGLDAATAFSLAGSMLCQMNPN